MATDVGTFNPVTLRFEKVASGAEVAELVDALDSKSSGASPRAGSIPAFGTRFVPTGSATVIEKTTARAQS